MTELFDGTSRMRDIRRLTFVDDAKTTDASCAVDDELVSGRLSKDEEWISCDANKVAEGVS